MNIWLGSDWHLWNTTNNSTHQYQTEQQVKRKIKLYADNIKEDDIFIFLGDLCDPLITDIPKLKSLITSIPGYKIICKGNHDVHNNDFYLELGFDQSCEICIYHNIIFSHKPIKVAPDEINIHGHLHSAKMSMMGYQHVNAYVANNKPVLLNTLLQDANTEQWDDKKDEWTNHSIEKINKYLTLDNDNYTDIIYLESIYDSPIDEDISAMYLSSLSAGTDYYINEILFPDVDSTKYWESDDNKYDEDLTKAELNETSNNMPKFNTPKEFNDWMRHNITYSEFHKLKSPDEVLRDKSGSCHDQVMFEYPILKKLKVNPHILFFIAYNSDSNKGGMTHTLCYWNTDNGTYWFENAWQDARGIRKYKDSNEMKNDIFHRYKNNPDFKKYPELEFHNISYTKFIHNITLGQFVDSIINESVSDLHQLIQEDDENDNIEIDPLHGEVNRFFNRIQDYHEATFDESSKKIPWVNDKGKAVPEFCPKCGTKTGIFLRGEPVFLCTNKKCHKYFGTVPFTNESANMTNMKQFTKEFVKNHPGPEPFIGESDNLPNHVIEMIDNVQFIDPINESAQDDDKLYPVYILIMHSGTPLSNAIKTVTHSHFSHSSISFDASLTNMYSFGRKSDINPAIAGFTKENIKNQFFQKHPIPYALYVVFYHKDEIDKMKKRIQYFVKNKSKFKYDFIGLFKNYLGVADNPEYRWFCSRFVADIINAGTPTNSPYFKEPSLIRPEDFQYTNFAQYISGGYLNEYDEKYTIKQTKKLERIERMKNDIDNQAIAESYDLIADNPYESNILSYQLSNMDETAFSDFLSYIKSFKLRFDKQGNIIITRREYDQLEKHFHNSLKLINAYEKAGNYPGVKEEICKIQYMVNLINKYYLTYKKDDQNKEIHKKMLDLRSVMLNVFQQKIKFITTHESDFNFQTYYDKSKYGNSVVIPQKVVTSIGKTILTMIK